MNNVTVNHADDYLAGSWIESEFSKCHVTSNMLNCFTFSNLPPRSGFVSNDSDICSHHGFGNFSLFMESYDLYRGRIYYFFDITLACDVWEGIKVALHDDHMAPMRSFVFSKFAFLVFSPKSSMVEATRFLTFIYKNKAQSLYGFYDVYLPFNELMFGIVTPHLGPLYAWEKAKKAYVKSQFKPLLRIRMEDDDILVEYRTIDAGTMDIKWYAYYGIFCQSSSISPNISVKVVVLDNDARFHMVEAKDIMCSGYIKCRYYVNLANTSDLGKNGEHYYAHVLYKESLRDFISECRVDYYKSDSDNTLQIHKNLSSVVSMELFKDEIVLFGNATEKGGSFIWKFPFKMFSNANVVDAENGTDINGTRMNHAYAFVPDDITPDYHYRAIKPEHFKTEFLPVDILETFNGEVVIVGMKNKCVLNSHSNPCAVSIFTTNKGKEEEVIISQFMNTSINISVEGNSKNVYCTYSRVIDLIFSLLTDALEIADSVKKLNSATILGKEYLISDYHDAMPRGCINAIIKGCNNTFMSRRNGFSCNKTSMYNPTTAGIRTGTKSIANATIPCCMNNNHTIKASNDFTNHSILGNRDVDKHGSVIMTLTIFPLIGFIALLLFIFYKHKKRKHESKSTSCFSRRSSQGDCSVLIRYEASEEYLEIDNSNCDSGIHMPMPSCRINAQDLISLATTSDETMYV